ncbi:MAG: SRPBCC domain-containing protein [Bacteroidetes bacterium]|nr:SRPBCC domain-containing protein [Bacteroidota bacterium]
MKNNNFHRTLTVKSSPAQAMKKISEVNGWWAKNFKGKAKKKSDSFTVQFGQTFVDFQVSELVPNKKVVWKVTDCNLQWINNKKEWNDTEVVFEISEKENSTQIDFTHIGLVPGVECYNDCEAGWHGHLTNSLVKFINEGKGMPE